jgi:type I restriction enzyme M protein
VLKQEQKNSIAQAIYKAWEVLRGIAEVNDAGDLLIAMLLLKYLSDIAEQNSLEIVSIGLTMPRASCFSELLAVRAQPGNGARIDAAFDALEVANIQFKGIFQWASFNSIRLANEEQRERVVGQLIDAFNVCALDFRSDRSSAAEAVAYACDSIIREISQYNGKRTGESFTPQEISNLIARLMQPAIDETVCDPCCGSGSLLISCSQFAQRGVNKRNIALFGQEKNGRTWAMAKMNMILHGETRYQLEWGDPLREPKLLSTNGSLQQFDVVVSNPPFSMKNWGYEETERDKYKRFWRGLPPRSSGDYAFISHMVESIRHGTGRMAIIVPLGVLFRGGAEQQIREKLLQENLIDAVIALPVKMFAHTGIPAAILIIRHGKIDTSVLFIDASRDFQHGKTQNIFRLEDLDRITNTYLKRDDVPEYARRVPQSEISANSCNLSVARYVSAVEEEEKIDLPAIRAERAQLQAELARLEEKLTLLREDSDCA